MVLSIFRAQLAGIVDKCSELQQVDWVIPWQSKSSNSSDSKRLETPQAFASPLKSLQRSFGDSTMASTDDIISDGKNSSSEWSEFYSPVMTMSYIIQNCLAHRIISSVNEQQFQAELQSESAAT